MPPAIIGGVIAGVGAIGSAAIGAGAAKGAAKANQQAADTAAAETRAARNQAYSTLNPFVQGGTAAGSQINALLGLGGTAGTMGTAAQPDYAGYVNSSPDLMAEFQRVGGQFGGDPAAYGQFHYGTYGQGEGRQLPTSGGTMGTPGVSAQQAAQGAFDQFRNSTGYQFRLGEGMNALNSGYAGAGTIKSGAAMRASTEYGQNFASGEFGNHLNALGNQQGVGLQAGSAAAGVGVNAANSLGNIAMQNGANQANAGLVRASTIGQGFAGTANALGTILGPQTNYAASMPTAAQINTNTLASLRGY